MVTTIAEPAVRNIPMALIEESSTNPRRRFQIEDMVASVREHGILAPLMVTPRGDRFMIVYGASRFRAGKAAGLKEAPALVRDLTDEQVLEIQLIENVQRKDLHPLEEADGYAALLALPGKTVDAMAPQIGKDRSYIYKRLQLAHLIPEAKEAFLDGRIALIHALEIAKLPKADDQKLAFTEGCGFPAKWGAKGRVFYDTAGIGTATQQELREFIRDHIMCELSAAPWKKDDAELVPEAGACSACPKRTAANPGLFGGEGGKVKRDRCLDRKCYEAKRAAFVQVSVKKAEGEGAELLKLSEAYSAKPQVGVIPNGKWAAAKKGCSDPKKGIIVDGDDVGKKLAVCLGCKPNHGWLLNSNRSPKAAPKPPSAAEVWREKRKRLDAAIEVEAARESVRLVMDKCQALGSKELMILIDRMVGQYLRHDGSRELVNVLGLQPDLKKKGGWRPDDAIEEFAKGLDAKKQAGFLMAVCCLTGYGQISAKDVLGLYGIDGGKVRAAVAKPMLDKFEAAKKKALARKDAKS